MPMLFTAALALALPLVQQAELPAPVKPVTVELGVDERAYESTNPNLMWPLTPSADGTLYFWAESDDFPIEIRLWSEGEEVVGVETADGREPWVKLRVVAGQSVEALVISSDPERGGVVTGHLQRAPDTEATRELARAVAALRQEIVSVAAGQSSDNDARVRALLERIDAEPEAPICKEVNDQLWELAISCSDRLSHDLQAELWRRLTGYIERYLPPSADDCLTARSNLAGTLFDVGRHAEALVEATDVLRMCDTHGLVNQASPAALALALAMKSDPSLDGAAALDHLQSLYLSEETPSHKGAQLGCHLLDALKALDQQERYFDVSSNMAATCATAWLVEDRHLARLYLRHGTLLHGSGALLEARRVLERSLSSMESGPLRDWPNVRSARGALANVSLELGDAEYAHHLFSELLETCLLTEGEDSDVVQRTRMNLAQALRALGRTEEALDYMRTAIEVWTAQGEGTADLVLVASGSLATALNSLGRAHEAYELLQHALEDFGELTSEHGSYESLAAMRASIEAAVGNGRVALELRREALTIAEERSALSSPEVLRRRVALVWSLLAEEEVGAEGQLDRLAADLDSALAALDTSRSPQELQAFAAQFRLPLATLLSTGGSDTTERLLAQCEMIRGVRLAAARLAHLVARDEQLEDAYQRLGRAATELVAGARSIDGNVADRAATVAGVRREIAAHVLALGVPQRLPLTDLDAVRASLDPNEAAVVFWTYGHTDLDADAASHLTTTASTTAFVVRPSGIARVQLGDVDTLRSAALAWRDGIVDRAPTEDPRRAGERLAALVWHPLAAHLEGCERLVVVPDAPLNLVPFDALPISEDDRLGDRMLVSLASSLRELASPPVRRTSANQLVALGDVDYDAGRPSVALPVEASAPSAASDEDLASTLRSPKAKEYVPLEQGRAEIDAVRAVLAAAMPDAEATLLFGADATRRALMAAAPRARWLHLVTHGYFDPSSITRSDAAARADSPLATSEAWLHERYVYGASPMALCGVALAGANAPPDERGHVEGLVTAQELSTFDLTGCELAVLSACETSLGVERYGRGVSSLQLALHLAGARTTVTSLWSVDDPEARLFFEHFYAALWRDGMGKAEALWQAKMALRSANYSVRDWAAWVLSGDPD